MPQANAGSSWGWVENDGRAGARRCCAASAEAAPAPARSRQARAAHRIATPGPALPDLELIESSSLVPWADSIRREAAGVPESWEVCVDNVLMRLALRAGLVAPGSLAEVRAGTLAVLKEVATSSGVPPPVLDDLLWERGRDDPDLLGTEGGDLTEPPRDPSSSWY